MLNVWNCWNPWALKVSLILSLNFWGLACVPATPLPPPPPVSPLPPGQALPANLAPYRHRLGMLTVQVVNPQGQPLPNAQVQIQQQTHAFPFGVALANELFQANANPQDQAQYRAIAKKLFNAAVHENALKWYDTEPQQGQVSYALADRILAWAQQQGWTMRGHTLFWEVEKWQQDWVKALPPDQLRAAVKNRAIEVCQRYRGKIDEFDLNNEMLHGDFYRSRLGPGIIKDMAIWCREGNPDAVFYVNDYGIINDDKLPAYVAQIKDLLQQGVPIGGIGIQAHIDHPLDIAKFKNALDTLAQFNLPLKITEVSVKRENDQAQAETLQQLYETAFAHPAVKEILLWGFWEKAHWWPTAALYREDFSPKPAATTYNNLLFQAWWTNETGTTNQAGIYQTPGFLGDYKITVTTPSETATKTIQLPAAGTSAQIVVTP